MNQQGRLNGNRGRSYRGRWQNSRRLLNSRSSFENIFFGGRWCPISSVQDLPFLRLPPYPRGVNSTRNAAAPDPVSTVRQNNFSMENAGFRRHDNWRGARVVSNSRFHERRDGSTSVSTTRDSRGSRRLTVDVDDVPVLRGRGAFASVPRTRSAASRRVS